MSKEEIEEAKKDLKKFCEYEDSLVLIDNVLYSYQDAIETLFQYIKQLEQENKNLEIVLENGLDKNKKYCFHEDGHTEKCLGYSNVDDDEPCEYCKSCEAINVKGDD